MRSGYGPEETMMMMVPEAYKKHPTLMVKYPEVSEFFFFWKLN
jgi:glutamate synthase (ferredoxin)